jgi:hypothetical protein
VRGKRRTATAPIDRRGWVTVSRTRKVRERSEGIDLCSAESRDSLSLDCRSTDEPDGREDKEGR